MKDELDRLITLQDKYPNNDFLAATIDKLMSDIAFLKSINPFME
jgi:hypothetical protein